MCRVAFFCGDSNASYYLDAAPILPQERVAP